MIRNSAHTDPQSTDPRLRGRRYDVPFAAVWLAAMVVAEESAGWSVVTVDPAAGVLRAEARSRLWSFVDDVLVRVSLDEGAITRVDLQSGSRTGRSDLGANARRIAGFLSRLDARLATPSPQPGPSER